MINGLRLIRNIGKFDSVDAAANIPLARLTLIYAENGRGKTTLSAILRSLATGDPIPIAERRRLTALHPPHVVLDCDGGPPAASFQNNAWNRTVPTMAVFDDVFVDENVYSGLAIGPDHRQNLHELILGSQGVALNGQLQQFVAQIEAHNAALRARATAIPVAERGVLSVDEFCALPARTNIDDEIQVAERNLAAAREQDPVRNTAAFDTLILPAFDVAGIDNILRQDLPTLDAAAAARVQAHLAGSAQGAEAWIAEGMRRLPRAAAGDVGGACPFCAQDLLGSPVIGHYRAYFSDAYRALKRRVSEALALVNRTHAGDVPAGFERGVRVMGERRQFWSRFCETPDVSVDTATIARDWRAAREAITEGLVAKQLAPLDRIGLSDAARAALTAYDKHRQAIATLSQQLQNTNSAIRLVKERVQTANPTALTADLARLKAVKARHTPSIAALCDAYLAEKAAKTNTERLRDQAKAALDNYRVNAFPGYQTAINVYLERFNAGFRLDQVTAANTRGGPTCTYNVVINNVPVPVAGSDPVRGQPSFRNTLSAGDRNTLALAFFFASLDQDPGLANKIVVVDDPLSSLDEHRSFTTVQEVRRLVQRSSQVIVLSHTKTFLGRIWDGSDRAIRAALQVTRDGAGSTIVRWDVDQDSISEHDRRHAMLRQYLGTGAQNTRDVARAIRPLLEAFLRVASPEYFPPGTLLGPFRGLCTRRVGTPQEILSMPLIQELANLTEYANRFHHDTNPAWETEAVNDGELRGFVGRALRFAKR
jgi:wobble nucleotide-excising tRNase